MPSTIAVIGASADRTKFGNVCVRAYARAGWHVYPVNPKADSIEGWPTFKSISDIPPDSVDRVSVYLPALLGVKAMDEIATKHVGEVWLNPGADDPAVVAKARELGLNVVQGCSIVAIGASPAEF